MKINIIITEGDYTKTIDTIELDTVAELTSKLNELYNTMSGTPYFTADGDIIIELN